MNLNLYEITNDKSNKIREFSLFSQILTYEGEYLNGKRSGKGKKYWNGKLEFEGE